MHTGAGEIVDNRLSLGIETQHQKDAAGLIFPQKAAGAAADNHNRDLLPVFLHVDSGPIAGISLNEDLSAPHGVACGIADAAVHHNPAFIHGVPHRILHIAVDGNLRAVEVGSQSVAGDALHGDAHAGHSGSQKPLTAAAGYGAFLPCSADQVVEFPALLILCIDHYHSYTTPPSFFLRYSALNANKFGTFFRLSKSISETGTRLRITEV